MVRFVCSSDHDIHNFRKKRVPILHCYRLTESFIKKNNFSKKTKVTAPAVSRSTSVKMPVRPSIKVWRYSSKEASIKVMRTASRVASFTFIFLKSK